MICTLRDGVKLAQNGDTILLHKGVYKEGNIIIQKSIHLIGIDDPVLDGENKYEILTLSGTGIVVRGIHFQGSGYSGQNDFASIGVINASHFIIENNTITHAYFAIHIANAEYGIVKNNTIIGTPKSEQTSGNGIHLWKCANMVLEENDIQGQRDGIYFEFVTHSLIQNNISHNNIRYGLHFMFSNNDAYMHNTFKENGAGIAVMYSNHMLMHSNTFAYNWGSSAYGVLLKEISDSRLYNNTFLQNSVGVLMESTSRIEVAQNNFLNNGWAFRIQASCSESEIHHNNFKANSFDVATNGTLQLNRFCYNYWDKYEGYDLAKNGIGDVPYHPVSMYSMVIEQNPNSLMLLRSFMVSLLDKAEKAIPSLTPEALVDTDPLMKPLLL
ncbi:MAG TPA: nitrous oxide reductase family maturation protein NosD [Chitinophagaceae bacterium]|nr:nitrous oxide reductase family maturation protein NosD [Chitinophagaceae bacterium]